MIRKMLVIAAAVAMPAAAMAALGFPGTEAASWQVRGRDSPAVDIPTVDIHNVQWQWYRDNPWVVDAGYARHRETLEILGLA